MRSHRSPSLRTPARSALAFAWALVAAYLLLRPSGALEPTGWLFSWASTLPRVDLIGHLVLFSVGGWLVERAVLPESRGHWLLTFVAVVLYSGVLEGLQSVIPGRSAQISDLFANSAGVALGLLPTRLKSGPSTRAIDRPPASPGVESPP